MVLTYVQNRIFFMIHQKSKVSKKTSLHYILPINCIYNISILPTAYYQYYQRSFYIGILSISCSFSINKDSFGSSFI